MKNDIYDILKQEKNYLKYIIIFGVAISTVSLTVPLAIQALVNAVSFGVVLQPIVVISILLFSVLVFYSLITLIQKYAAEIVERRIFLRLTQRISFLLTKYKVQDLEKINQLDFLNKFFDVGTLQKSLTILSVDGVSVVLQCLVGLVVLAFYHPFFLLFDFILISSLWLIFRLCGANAFEASYEESTQKYKVAAWLETLSRRNLFFRSKSGEKFAEFKTMGVLTDYITSRRKYFKLYIVIVSLTLVIYTLSTSFLLGVGGWLVTKNQLSLGQLVAAELILAIILGGVAKSGKLLDAFFDLKSSLKKLNQFESIEFESEVNGAKTIDPLQKLTFNHVECYQDTGVYHYNYNYNFIKGSLYSIQTYSSSSKLYFTRLILSLQSPKKGVIYWNNSSLAILDASSLRERMAIISEAHFFHGSIKENLTCLYPQASPAEISEILEGCDLNKIISSLPDGIETLINEDGYPLSLSQSYRLNLAANLFTPKDLIVLDQWIDFLEESKKSSLLGFLRNKYPDAIIIFFGRSIDTRYEIQKLILNRDGFINE